MPKGISPRNQRAGKTIAERIAYYSRRSACGCLLWTASTNEDGYPHMNIGGKTRRVSRYLWEQENGPIPPRHEVMHDCDKPRCIDLRHFKLGTHAENMADMAMKSRARAPRGESNGLAKLTEAEVRAIRLDPRPCPAIAADYGIARTTAWQVKTGRGWGHIR